MTNIEAEIANTLKEIEELKTDTGVIVAKAKAMNDADDIHKECKHGVMLLDYCQECDADATYQGDTTNEQMINLNLKTIEKLSRLKLKNIDIYLTSRFKEEGLRFEITIHNKKGENLSFHHYLFWTFEKNFESVRETLKIIEKDDYQSLKELQKERSLNNE